VDDGDEDEYGEEDNRRDNEEEDKDEIEEELHVKHIEKKQDDDYPVSETNLEESKEVTHQPEDRKDQDQNQPHRPSRQYRGNPSGGRGFYKSGGTRYRQKQPEGGHADVQEEHHY
jgi:hypothetical protein